MTTESADPTPSSSASSASEGGRRDDWRTDVEDPAPDAERAEKSPQHKADRPATADEEAAAEDAASDVDPNVAEHEREMMARGAQVKGEGEVN